MLFRSLDILENEERAKTLVERGRETLKKVQWETSAKNVLAVYEQLTGGAS